jgi:hypothetical protein
MASKILRGTGRDGRSKGSHEGARGTDGILTGSEPVRASAPDPQGVENLANLKERILEKRLEERLEERLKIRSQGRAAEPAGQASDVAAAQDVEDLAWPSLDGPVPPPYFDEEPRPDAGSRPDAQAASKASAVSPAFAATLLGVPVARGLRSQLVSRTTPGPPPQTEALVLHDRGAVPALMEDLDPTTVNPVNSMVPVVAISAVEAQEISEEQGFTGHLPWYEQSPGAEDALERPRKKRVWPVLLGLSLVLVLAVAGLVAVRRGFMGRPAPSATEDPTGIAPAATAAIAPAAAPAPPRGSAGLSPPTSAPVVTGPAATSSVTDEPDPSIIDTRAGWRDDTRAGWRDDTRAGRHDGTRAVSPSGPQAAPRPIGAVDHEGAPPRSGSAISNALRAAPAGGTFTAQPRQRSAALPRAPTANDRPADKSSARPRTMIPNGSSPAASAPSSPAAVPAGPGSPESSPPKASSEKLKGKPNDDPDSTLPLNVE